MHLAGKDVWSGKVEAGGRGLHAGIGHHERGGDRAYRLRVLCYQLGLFQAYVGCGTGAGWDC